MFSGTNAVIYSHIFTLFTQFFINLLAFTIKSNILNLYFAQDCIFLNHLDMRRGTREKLHKMERYSGMEKVNMLLCKVHQIKTKK